MCQQSQMLIYLAKTNDPALGQPIVGGSLVFKNSQRTFQNEVSTSSTFLKNADTKTKKSSVTNVDDKERIRLMFDSPSGYHREILVGVTPNTSKRFDIGYDAPYIEDNVEDMYWVFNNVNYVIQSIGNFDEEQTLPIGIKTNTEGLAVIRIKDLENIDPNKTIFLHDNELNIYHNLKESDYEIHLTAGGLFK